jgi:hypothetical protein
LVIENYIICVVTPVILKSDYRRFEGICCFHLLIRRWLTCNVVPKCHDVITQNTSIQNLMLITKTENNKLSPQSATELYPPSDRRLSSKLMPTSADRGFRVGRVTDPYDRNLAFLDRSRYFFFQVAPQLYSRR